MSGYYVDLSGWNRPDVDWPLYKQWSAQFDGISRVALRSSYGVGYVDKNYRKYREEAEKAGIDVIIHYHYCYPDLNYNAINEVEWQKKVIGDIRPNDLIMLDIEENARGTGLWCLNWLQHQERGAFPSFYKLPLIYASHSYIQSSLSDIPSLAKYPLVLAHWNITDMPACPLPWAKYQALQIKDDGNDIPGINGKVDLNLWVG